MSNKSGTSSQAISLPTGGGALSGIGETFSPDLFTGTGNFTVPIEVPAGRNGFQPKLSLTYSTGDGNGPFGLGWRVSVPSVTRKTSSGVPRYRDGSADAQDTFVLSGSDDLVPVAEPESGITRFRPRTEGLFARIDRVRNDGDMWRVSTKDGLVSTYGGGAQPAVVADPADRSRVFRWLLSETTDPFGNRIAYRYHRDSGVEGPHEWDQLYLDTVEYVDYDRDGETRFLVSVTFVYEERPDPFSDHRAGFEIRTRLRCRRIEVRTHADEALLTRTYELEYLDNLVGSGERPASDLPLNGVSLLTRIRVVGHDGEQTEALPPLEFGYGRFAPERQRFQPIEANGDALPAVSLADADYDTVDLFGNGLPDIVQMNGSMRYWRNLGGGRFDRPREIAEVPAGVRLADPGVQFADMNGDGRADLLVLSQHGYFPLAFGGEWSARGFVQYPVAPSVVFGADDIRLVDLDGDGVVDALRTGSAFELYFNDPRRGWERVETRPRRPAAEFPDIQFSDPRVKLADLNGDGLQDIVLVDQGRIDYWPYLGHGNWGRRVKMEASPVFRDEPPLPGTGFDPRRVLFGDLDGDGVDDIVYVQSDRVTCWINQGGHRWSEPFDIDGTPPFTDIDGVRVTDMLGAGMDGVLWTAEPVPGTGSHYRFLDLTGGSKPYLLERMTNNVGAVTNITYTTSTSFYLADEGDPATRWKTPLPFPVHVVESVEVIDEISGGKLTNEFRYHHGYWDGFEREFRGFGMVEQLDSETFARFHAGSQAAGLVAVDEQRFSPPLLTKTWFHQGPTGDEFEDFEEPDRSAEFWQEDPPVLNHIESVNAFLAPLPRSVRRDALRSLRGSVLRSELYAHDGSEHAGRPYSVMETAYGLREESPPGEADDGRSRIFFPHRRATRISQWERGTEPMTSFEFTQDHDPYGQPRSNISLAVPRGRDFRTDAPQAEPYLGTVTTATFAQRDDAVRYIVDRVARATTHEIVNDGRQSVFALRDAVRRGAAQLGVIAQSLTYFDGPAFEGLPFGRLDRFGAPVRSETLVLSEDILGDDVPPYLQPAGAPRWTDEYPEEFRRLLPALAGYRFSVGDGTRVHGWFAQQERHRYDIHDDQATGRGLVLAQLDPLGRQSSMRYDEFGLLAVHSTDAAGLSTTAVPDYRVLQPRLTTDVNDNRTAYAFTPLGLLERVAVMGKEGETVGDTLAAPGTRYVYDLLAATRSAPGERPKPVSVRTIRRVHHATDTSIPTAERNQTIETVEYSDGLGRMVQTRSLAEDEIVGDALRGAGVLPVDQDNPDTQREVRGRRNSDAARPNVVVSGWKVLDNKGRVVESYQPFFSTGWDFAAVGDAQLGQRITVYYDPTGRVVRTVNPDGSEQRVVHGVPLTLTDPEHFRPTPWEIYTYDPNDNAGRTYGAEAAAYLHHTDTPTSVTVDALGRVVRTIQRTRPPRRRPSDPLPPIEELRGRASYDIRGNPLLVTDAVGRPAFRYRYDLANRPLRTENIDAGAQQVVLDAAGHQIERRDSKGALILQAHDVLNRPIRLWARDDSSSRIDLRGRLEYGDGGNPAQPPAERAAARAANRLSALHRHYDEAGLVIVDRRDFKGNVLQRSRQAIAEEQILSVFPAAGDPARDWTVAAFRVDWEPTGETLDEHAARLLDPTPYTTVVRYDALNRVQSQRCSSVEVDGEGKEMQLAYDRSGAVAQIRLDGDVVVERIAYNADGQRTLVALGNGIMTRFAYDPRTLRLTRMRSDAYTRPASDGLTYRPSGPPRQDLAYRYDPVGNLLGVADRTPGCGVQANPTADAVANTKLRALVARGDALVRSFAYDPLYRLVSATGRECKAPHRSEPWADARRCGFDSGRHGTPNQNNAPSLTVNYRQDFDYDPVGNLVQLTHAGAMNGTQTHELIDGSNRLRRTVSGQTTIPYSYDDSGNLIAEATSRHFEWDYRNRMKAFRTQTGTSEPTVHAHYLYGADGARVRKVVRRQGGDVEVTTYIDDVFEHHRWGRPGEAGSANTTVHVTDGQERVARVRTGPAHPDDHGPALQYIQGDHLGSGSITSDKAGGFVNREEFTPYGETCFGSFGRKRYRFCGKERDAESGLSSHGNRYYAPYLARWTSTDPAGPVDGGNLYTYCRANPLVLVDPTGRNAEKRVEVTRQLYRTAEEFETASRQLGSAQGALAVAEAEEMAATQAWMEAKSDLKGPQGGLDPAGYRSAMDQYRKELLEARRVANEARERVTQLERRFNGLSKELNRLRKQAIKLGMSPADALKPQEDVARIFEMHGRGDGGGGGGGGNGGGSGGGGTSGGPAPTGGGGTSGDAPRSSKSLTETVGTASRGGPSGWRGGLVRGGRWVGKSVKAAKSIGTAGLGLLSGEAATRLCTPRSMTSEGQREAFATGVAFVPPLLDIFVACNLGLLYDIYAPIPVNRYSEAELRTYREMGVTPEMLQAADAAVETLLQGRGMPRFH